MHEWRVFRAAGFVAGTAGMVLGLLAPPGAGAEQFLPFLPNGSEFQVNTYTPQRQFSASVTADAHGNFIVVWQSNGSSGTDTSSESVQGQRYALGGMPQGAQFQVNTYTTSGQGGPSVAADADGDFVVVWSGLSATDASGGIQGQRYASDGSTQGAEFQVNTYTTDTQIRSSVARESDGDFVVVWQSLGSFGTDTSNTSVQGQRFASDGSTQGAQFQVNDYTTDRQTFPSVAADADGDFVVVWMSIGSFTADTHSNSILGQRYASDGSTQGANFLVNTYTTGSQADTHVAMDADGGFVVVWSGPMDTDTSGRVLGQRFASSGSALGGEFQVNTYTSGDQGVASVSREPDGDFVVVWHSFGSSGTDKTNFSIQGQRYASDGSTQGEQFQVNTYTFNDQLGPAVAAPTDQEMIVVWQSLGSSGTDSSLESIHAQRYRPGIVAPALSPVGITVLGAALMLLGVGFARAYGRVSRRDRFCGNR